MFLDDVEKEEDAPGGSHGRVITQWSALDPMGGGLLWLKGSHRRGTFGAPIGSPFKANSNQYKLIQTFSNQFKPILKTNSNQLKPIQPNPNKFKPILVCNLTFFDTVYKVQFDQMPYIGICGGASMAGSAETCAYGCGLDLMQGREIFYATHSQVNMISNRQNQAFSLQSVIGNRLAFTEKVGFAVLLTAARFDAVCFPCVKNSGKVWDFAASHTDLLKSIVQQLAHEWKEFRDSANEPWFFNLLGYYCFSDSDWHLV